MVQPTDAEDIGFPGYMLVDERLSSYTFSTVINRFNPPLSNKVIDQDFNRSFAKVVRFARAVLRREIERAREVVQSERSIRLAISQAEDPRVVAETKQGILALVRQALRQEI